MEFPRDHGAHPEFQQEWWYYSGHLESADGELLGYQLTFFRLALEPLDSKDSPAGSVQNLFTGHLALTIPAQGDFISRCKVAPEILGLARASTHRLDVRVEDWRLEIKGDAHHLHACSQDLSLDLVLTPAKPLTLHGQGGYVAKDAKNGSGYHFSLTRLATRGEVVYGQRAFKVTGTSWFDREFGTTLLGPQQRGWDWFALQLADGWDLMLYLLREQDGRFSPHSYGAIIDPQGRVSRLAPGDFRITATGHWKSPRSGAVYPAGWRLTIPGKYANLTIIPTMADQEVTLFAQASLTYWEGQVTVTGEKGQEGVSGRGYVELTGYARSMQEGLAAPERLGPKGPP